MGNSSVVQAGPCLKNTATSLEILEAMKNPLNGLMFISQQNLPSSTFIAADAINWLLLRMEGVTTLDKAIQVSKQNIVSIQIYLFFC